MRKIPLSYRKAFSLLSERLLYAEAPSKRFPFTVATISQEIQRQFVDLHERSQETFLKKFGVGERFVLQITDPDGQVVKVFDDIVIPEERVVYSLKESSTSLFSDYGFVIWLSELLVKCNSKYLPWGFTPRLAYSDSEQLLKANCFGTAVLLGSHFRKRGIRVELAITPDHPLVIVHVNGAVFATDITGRVVKLMGKFKKYRGYRLYYPIEKELELYKLFMVYPFDEAVLYEILENAEALRRISLGQHRSALPQNYVEATKIAKEHEQVLQMTDWKDLQQLLFPDMYRAFLTHQKEWFEEVRRIKEIRGNHYGQHVWEEISKNAQAATSLADCSHEDALGAILEEAGPHLSEIFHFMIFDKPFLYPDTIPDNSRNYFSAMRDEMKKIKESDPHFCEVLEILMCILQKAQMRQFAKEEESAITN